MAYKRISPIPVVEGGTGAQTLTTAYAPVCAGTTATDALQVASTGLSTSGLPFISNGSSTLPSFTALSASNVNGSISGSNPSAGVIGELISSVITSPVSIPTITATNITSISLTAGIWNVSALLQFSGPTTGIAIQASISITSATLGTFGDNTISFPFLSMASQDLGLTIPSYRIAINSTTTIYLVGKMNYSVGTGLGYGRISATRVG